MVTATYTRASSVPLVTLSERTYAPLTVRDLPEDEKPRERLLAYGPAALSTPDLLAVVLSTGTTKEDVLAMSRRVMKDYGEKGVMSEKDAKKLSDELGIPQGKALQIIAVAELGRRFFEKSEGAARTLRTARDVFEHVRDMGALPKEHLRGLYLNAHYKVIHDEVISIGTLDASIVHARDVFRPAIDYSAAAVILVHNHPSGVADASAADREITQRLVESGKLLGIALVDHVIVTKDAFSSVPASYDA